YHLAKPLNEIDVMTIITAVDESVNAMQCGGQGNCQGGAMCLTHDLWCALSMHIEQYLKNISLDQLLEMENVKDVSHRQQLLHEAATERTEKNRTTNPNIIFPASEVNPA
ncbi:MAG TPA: Rrf2 family transcriptional regulator, partial [Psychrobacter sp.]|nr:Rrf2 family transcriptional regulator [Psychrobacter sp.]